MDFVKEYLESLYEDQKSKMSRIEKIKQMRVQRMKQMAAQLRKAGRKSGTFRGGKLVD